MHRALPLLVDEAFAAGGDSDHTAAVTPGRIAIVGNSGSGKTTLAKRVAAKMGLEPVELDAIYHQPDWASLPADEFRREVARHLDAPTWVVDGNYSMVRDLVWSAADTVVWLDLPRHRVMPALLRRTLARMMFRTELWNGNRERFRNLFERRPEENILLWAWTRDGYVRERYEREMTDPGWRHLQFVRLRSRRAAEEWMTGVTFRPRES